MGEHFERSIWAVKYQLFAPSRLRHASMVIAGTADRQRMSAGLPQWRDGLLRLNRNRRRWVRFTHCAGNRRLARCWRERRDARRRREPMPCRMNRVSVQAMFYVLHNLG